MNINEFCTLLLEFLSLYIIIKSFLCVSLKPNKKDVSACIIITLLNYFDYEKSVLIWILTLVFYLGYVFSLTQERLINRLLLYCISYITIFIIQIIIAFIFSLFNITYDNLYVSLIGNPLTIFILLIILLFTPYKRLYTFISKAANIYKILLINTYLVCVTTLLYMKLMISSFYQNILYFITIVTLIIAVNVYILYYEQKLFLQQQQLASYATNLPIYKSLIDEIRASQHEFSNRIQDLERLPYICKDYDAICAALLKYTNDYKKPLRAYPLLQLNMPLLSATLYNLYVKAYEKNITILFDISSSNIKSYAPEYELSDFINILTQNAIEACEQGDKIYIHIISVGATLQFEIRNPIKQQLSATELSQFFQKGFSTKIEHIKEDGLNHGLGLYYLSNQIKKYNGTIGIDCTRYDNCYWVILNLEI
ncbi:MAG: GHKL domain-containing protein [Clostridium sp.]|nr:GHKL domain-containing protein [Clostridium sp.]